MHVRQRQHHAWLYRVKGSAWHVSAATALLACASGEAPVAPAQQRLGVTSLALGGVAANLHVLAVVDAAPFDAGAFDAGGHASRNPAAESPDVGTGSSGPGGATVDAAALPSNDCCSTSSSGGCADEAVAACVCGGDPFCCSEEYDALCVNQAVSRCGQDCDERLPVSDCCGASGVPGCTVPEVQACICDIDPFCCVFRFDQNCVSLGVARCNLSCDTEEERP